jgi:hypothetical protein
MTRTKILTLAGSVAFLVLILSIGCTKNPVTPPPVHDTVTVIKNDTTTKIDTLYATKPDTTIHLTKGLLLYLPFSGNIADSSGNANPTTAYGSVLTYDAHGWANNAFGATGNGEEVLVTNNGSIKFDTAFSLSFGFLVNTVRPCSFISMVDPATGLAPSFNIGFTLLGAPNNFAMGIGDSSIGCGNYGVINNYSIVDTTNWTPYTGAWYNAVAIYHKGALDIYINGNLMIHRQGLGHKVVCCPGSKVVIGNWWNDPNYNGNIPGKLDNIRLYNRVLTPHEIAALSSNYQVTSTSVKPGLRTH